VLLGGVVLIFIKTFSVLSPVILSFFLVLLISLAVNPLIARLRAWTGGRKTATILVAAALLGVLALTGWALVGPLKTTVAHVAANIPSYIERFQKPLMIGSAQTPHSAASAATGPPPTNATKNSPATTPTTNPGPPKNPNNPGSILSYFSEVLQGTLSGLKSMALSASQMAAVFITVFFGVTFTLMDPHPIFGAIFSIVPERHHERTLVIMQRIGKFLPTWALATLVAMVCVGSLVFFLMWPFFGFVDAMVLGLIAGIFEAVPYLGPLLSAVPAFLFSLTKGGMTPVWVLLLYLMVQLLENNLITPLIMARNVKLHPVAVLFAILISVEMFGVLGVLVAVPMAGIADILHTEIYRQRYLPSVTDADLKSLARNALREKAAVPK